MAISHAEPGEIIDVRPLGTGLVAAHTTTLVKSDEMSIIRLIVLAGKEIPSHKAKGALVVQCLEGKIAFTAYGKTQDLEAGQLLHLPVGEPHALRGVEDGSLLLTILS